MDIDSQLDAHVRRIIALHFDLRGGSPYWLERQQALRLHAVEEIHCFDDLDILGQMDETALCDRPIIDFVPISLRSRLAGAVVTDTGGTTGQPKRTIFSRDEFASAFVDPFVCVANHIGFPLGANWLFVGPSGPHVIGQAAAACATALGGLQPFSVDFDPRWFRKLPPDSVGRERYLRHILDQALDIVRSQSVEVLFTTPLIIRRLAESMTDAQRDRVRGVHYGGMRVDPELLAKAQVDWFSNAVHVAGYGNSLSGVCMEPGGEPTRSLCYFPFGVRHQLRFTTNGQVRIYRLDETNLIVNLVERDVGRPVRPPVSLRQLGFGEGVENPAPPAQSVDHLTNGIY